jgi:hypothetical protein
MSVHQEERGAINCPAPPGSGWQIRPQAPPSLRPSGLPFRKGALDERGGGYVTETKTIVKGMSLMWGRRANC